MHTEIHILYKLQFFHFTEKDYETLEIFIPGKEHIYTHIHMLIIPCSLKI